MSGPWEDFAPTTTAPTPGKADLQPWEEFSAPAPAPAAPAAPAPAKTPEEVHAGVTAMLKRRAPLKDIQSFVASSGYQIEPDTQKWLDQHYDDTTPKSVPAQHWEVNVRGEPPKTNALSSWWHGVQSGALRGYDDELEALSNAVGGEIGLNNNDTGGFWDRYNRALPQMRDAKDRALQDHPVAYGFGFVPGALTGPSYFRTPAGSVGGRVAQSAGTAGIEGLISGSGNAEGGFGDRLLNAGEGGLAGLLAGTVLHPLGAAANGILGRIVERVRPANGANSLNSGLDVLFSRAPQDAEAMAARAQEMTDAGVPPRLVDVVDESGRGVIRAAGSKMTPAREAAARHADTVYTDAQDRVASQAIKHISDAPKTARQIGDRIAEEQKAMGPRFDAVRNEPVTITPEMIKAFSTAEGRSVLRSIARYMTPEEQKPLTDLIQGIQKSQKLGSAEDQARKLFPGFDSLSPQAQQQMIKQLDIKDPLANVHLTVDIADKFSRMIKDRAGENPAMQRVAKDYADTIRGAARTQHPDYDEALNDFEAVAKIGNAAKGERQFENTDYLSTPPDQYAKNVGSASNLRPDYALPTEAEALRIRARDDVVDKATSGGGQNAMAVARQISRGSAQKARTQTLIGREGAQNLEAGMRHEVARVDNTRYIDPRIGSKTAPMAEDAAHVDHSMNFVADSTRGIWGIVHGAARWLRGAGIRGVDAERLTRDAISEDPARVQQAIDFMAQRGLDKARARGLVRQIQRNAKKLPGRAAGAFVGDEQSAPPPNSVRAVLREGRAVK